MNLRVIVLTVAAVGLVSSLSGCATYRCKNFPKGSCQNMSQIYDGTGAGFEDYREGKGKETKYASGNGKQGGAVVIGNTVKGINELQAGDPVLTKPQVLRAWIKPWEDKEKDLNYSFVYIRVKDSEWTVLQ